VTVVYYYSVRKYTKTSNRWDPISYFDHDGYFRGSANRFETREDAQRYLEEYQTKMNNRVNTYGRQITSTVNGKLRLKVFEEKKES
jgi:hypothetical protein